MCFPCRHTCLISFFAFYACVFSAGTHTWFSFLFPTHVFSLLPYMPNFLFCFLRMCFLCRHTYLISFFVSYACVSLTIIHTQIFFSSFMHVFHLNNKKSGKWTVPDFWSFVLSASSLSDFMLWLFHIRFSRSLRSQNRHIHSQSGLSSFLLMSVYSTHRKSALPASSLADFLWWNYNYSFQSATSIWVAFICR